jgi:Family of unknown function (DUF6529)
MPSCPAVGDAIERLAQGNVAGVKTVLASVALALAVYQLVLIAIGYGKLRLPFLGARPASGAHRASGDAIATLLVLVGAACVAVYGLDDDMVVHAVAGAALLGVLAAKVAVVRRGLGLSHRLPLFGGAVFVLLCLTWATSAPEALE